MNLGHAPVIQKLSATYGVAKMSPPIISHIDIGHRRRDAAFSHYGVSLAEQRFANDSDRCTLAQSFYSGTESGATRAYDQYIMFVSFELFHQTT